ncbi:Resolvase/invertase-type recombinase catalytic domain-containing protein [Paenibacillus alkaliterrae]
MKLYGIGDFAKMVGVTQQTLRNWDKLGKLKPHHVSDSGYRYYSQTQLNELLRKKEPAQRMIVGYARVSSPKQKDDLERQIENIKMYMLAKGYSFEMISDIGSGIEYPYQSYSPSD